MWRRFSEEERQTIWDMREAGVPVKRIARHLGRQPVSLRKFCSGTGGKRLSGGELLGISWDDLKLDGPMPVVRIRRQLLRHGGQGVLLSDLKTAGSRRTLHLSQPLVDHLRVHRARQVSEKQAARTGATQTTCCSRQPSAARSTPRP